MSDRLVVLGAGGHSVVVIATARAAGFEVVAVFDDREAIQGGEVLGAPIVGTLHTASQIQGTKFIVAVGDWQDREAVVDRLDLDYISLAHPDASIASDVNLGVGTVVAAASAIQPRTVIGQHVIINTGAIVDHDCVIGSFAHVAPGATVCGGVSIAKGALIGAGSTVVPGVNIGDGVVVGSGAVVTEDVAHGETVVGIPARPIGD